MPSVFRFQSTRLTNGTVGATGWSPACLSGPVHTGDQPVAPTVDRSSPAHRIQPLSSLPGISGASA